jgi:Uma2 family endonuclease
MGETPIHVEAIFLLHQALQDYFRARPEVFIASDIFWYWEKGVPASCCAPDTMVVLGAGSGRRRSFFSWREQNPIPNAVFEMASENTWREDLGEKKALYQRLRVPEYFIFDPLAEFLDPPLRGFRLRGRTYRPLRPAADLGLSSKELGLRLVPEDTLLRLIDAATGEKVLTREDRIEYERRLVADRVEQERQLADDRIERERRRAQDRVDQERQIAERERQEKRALEAEIARLHSLLEKPPDHPESSS